MDMEYTHVFTCVCILQLMCASVRAMHVCMYIWMCASLYIQHVGDIAICAISNNDN